MHRVSPLLLVLILGGAAAAPPATAQSWRVAPVDTVRLARLLDSLPLRARIGQLIIPWMLGSPAASDPALARIHRLIDSLEIGGILTSTGTPLESAAKLNALQRRSRLPLLVTADLEGGTAFRWSGGTPFPTNMGVGAGASEGDAYTMGRITAAEGRAVGVHITFAPVADVNNNPANPIINTRSFGADPALVSRLVAAAVRGTQDGGMVATAKHFPGHGDTETDSHIDLPVIRADWARLDSVELPPFRAAIAAGVGAVMSAHVAMPGIDGGRTRPATLAPEILSGLLRDSLGFRGLIVTDALDMGALVRRYGQGEAAVLAFLAGSDILLQPSDPEAVARAMEAAVREGRISEARLNASVRRILELKMRMGLFDRRIADLNEVARVVMNPAHRDAALDASRRAIVLVRDDQGAVDSLRAGPRTIVVVAFGDANGSVVGDTLVDHLRRAGHTARLAQIRGGAQMATDLAAARQALARGGVPVFAVSVRVTSGQARLALPEAVAALIEETARRMPAVLVSLGSPYVIGQVPSVGGYLAAWTANPLTERAVAEALSGGIITGRLPIPLPPAIPLGAGLDRIRR